MFEDAGVAIPTDDWTYVDAQDAAQKLSKDSNGDGRTDVFGWSAVYGRWGMQPILEAFGGARVLTSDGRACTLDGEPFREAAKFWLDVIYEDKTSPRPGDPGGWLDGLVGGALAMQRCFTGHPLAWQGIIGNKFRFDVVLQPLGPGGDRGGELCSDFLMMGGQTKHPEETWEAIKFYCSEEVGIRRTLMGSGDPGARPACWTASEIKQAFPWWRDEFAEAFAEFTPDPPVWNLRGSEAAAAYANNIEDLVLRKVSIDEGTQQIVAAIDKVLEKPMIEK